jgi:FkbM family methyltransferase
MNKFRELILSVSAKPSVIVHLGAGKCGEVALYRSLGADRIIFTEPDPELARKAINKFKDSQDVAIFTTAVASSNNQQFFNITNNRRFSSLHTPAGLYDFYPNIEIVDRIKVDTITLEQLCENAEIDIKSDNLLITELQGEERNVFPREKKDILQRFKWVIIRSSEEEIYTPSNGTEQADIHQVMLDAGFLVLNFNEDTPPFVNSLCIRNDSALQVDLLTDNQALLRESILDLENKLSEQQVITDDLTSSHSLKVAEMEQALKSKSKEISDSQEKIEELSKSLNTISTELADAQAQAAELLNEKEGLLQQNAQLNESTEAYATATSEMQQTLRINTKLMLKSENDLKDLQLQYRSALEYQEQQNALLSELKTKLRQASRFYKSLNLQNLVLEGIALEQVDSNNEE